MGSNCSIFGDMNDDFEHVMQEERILDNLHREKQREEIKQKWNENEQLLLELHQEIERITKKNQHSDNL